jgi:hypothetical protein
MFAPPSIAFASLIIMGHTPKHINTWNKTENVMPHLSHYAMAVVIIFCETESKIVESFPNYTPSQTQA